MSEEMYGVICYIYQMKDKQSPLYLDHLPWSFGYTGQSAVHMVCLVKIPEHSVLLSTR